MRKEFVMRGQTASTAGKNTEILNFGKYKPGYAYRLTEFVLYPSFNIGGGGSAIFEACASITAGKTSIDPQAPNFNDDGLIGTALFLVDSEAADYQAMQSSVVNDTFMITQNLILRVHDQGGNALPVNWQCRFESVKMTGAEEAAVNYKQFTISDGS
jgi:hypothetical protein